MLVRVHWWRDTLRACRLAIPPLVAVLLVIGVARFVTFMKVYGAGLSVYECVWLARGLGRLESLAAPFLVASVWLVAYPLLVGLRWATRSRDRDRRRRQTAASPTPANPRPAVTSSARTPTVSAGRRKSSVA
jgi:hypothetical protein